MQVIEANDPRYTQTFIPENKCRVFSDERMLDDEQNEFAIVVTYHYYRDNNGVMNVFEYMYHAIPPFVMTEESMNESVREAIRMEAREPVTFEINKPNFK